MTFICAGCQCSLTIKKGPVVVGQVAGAVLAIAALSHMGVRSDAGFVVSLVAISLSAIASGILTGRLFASEFEVTGNYEHILHPGRLAGNLDDTDTEEPGTPALITETPDTTVGRPDDGPAILRIREEPRSLEGTVIGLALTALIISNVYILTAPLLFRMWPGFLATKVGPPTFPVRVVIGERAVEVSNGSAVPWQCRLSLSDNHFATAKVDAGQTTPIRYARFLTIQEGSADDSERRSAASRRITISCTEPSGESRWTSW